MTDIQFGRLQQVDIREIWQHEANHFTPWLSENLPLLGEALGIELELESEEKSVGSFRADIVAKDVLTDGWVLIENQLGRTDHGHLGQVITYAAGLKAATVVWLAYQFTDEHIAALDWLNSITDDGVRFFGVQIELWQIESSIAPKFNIVCRPNSWVKKGKRYKISVNTSDAGEHDNPYARRGIGKDLVRRELMVNPNATVTEIVAKTGLAKGTVSPLRNQILREMQIEAQTEIQVTPVE